MPHNINSVIRDIDKLERQLKRKPLQSAVAAMELLKQTMVATVKSDADYRGNLIASIHSYGVKTEQTDIGEYEVSAGQDTEIAPYGPFVEFGTGERTDQQAGAFPSTDTNYPAGYPYKSPSMSPGLTQAIIEWVEGKPIIPMDGDMSPRQLGLVIAASIVEHGTYAHPYIRPAWYKQELRIQQSIKNAVKGVFR